MINLYLHTNSQAPIPERNDCTILNELRFTTNDKIDACKLTNGPDIPDISVVANKILRASRFR